MNALFSHSKTRKKSPAKVAASHHGQPAIKDPAAAAFLDALAPVLVEDTDGFAFDGAIEKSHAVAIWTWFARDAARDKAALLEDLSSDADALAKQVATMLPAVEMAIEQAIETSQTDPEFSRRFIIQVGGDEVLNRLPVIVAALHDEDLFKKAMAFGRATNKIADESSLGLALQSMPRRIPVVAALLMQAAVSQMTNPSRVVAAAIHIAGSPSERALKGAGFAPLVDAMLAHAQNQIEIIGATSGPFADIDLMCETIARFHSLIRAINGYVEIEPNTRWQTIVAELVKRVSAKIEPWLREVSADVLQSLRRSRDAVDRLDCDRLLSALNGVFLLATVRDSRESLALNSLFERTWKETGQALEILIGRNLEAYKKNPADDIVGQRLDAAIKMADLRFNADYAGILRRARASADRRATECQDAK